MSASPLERKILSRDEAVERYGPGREFRLVFTNGCFDLLHAGHVQYLSEARALGDALVIGLNTDASVRRLKGQGRPLTSQDERALVLAALSAVDAVTLFDDDTPAELIDALQPDILAKGGDYAAEDVVGGETVARRGGSVRILPLRPGVSTTGLIRRLRQQGDERA
ncbi:MAG: D-glycero-beta-D-manno-heptose 1-phosphate adenylyltransferase [Longimicrobiales bacterium]